MIKGEKVILRRIKKSDFQNYYRWVNNSQVAHFWFGVVFNTFETNDDNEFSGRVEIDIMIGDSDQWGKGYGADALNTMVRYCFDNLKAERVYLIPRNNNPRAVHVYEKVGFKKEGILRHWEKFEGEWIDGVIMAIIKEDYKGILR